MQRGEPQAALLFLPVFKLPAKAERHRDVGGANSRIHLVVSRLREEFGVPVSQPDIQTGAAVPSELRGGIGKHHLVHRDGYRIKHAEEWIKAGKRRQRGLREIDRPMINPRAADQVETQTGLRPETNHRVRRNVPEIGAAAGKSHAAERRGINSQIVEIEVADQAQVRVKQINTRLRLQVPAVIKLRARMINRRREPGAYGSGEEGVFNFLSCKRKPGQTTQAGKKRTTVQEFLHKRHLLFINFRGFSFNATGSPLLTLDRFWTGQVSKESTPATCLPGCKCGPKKGGFQWGRRRSLFPRIDWLPAPPPW